MSADSPAATESDTDVGDRSLPLGRFGRLVTLVAFVTAVFLFIASQSLSGRLFSIAVVVIGSIALVTAISGFLIATVATLEKE